MTNEYGPACFFIEKRLPYNIVTFFMSTHRSDGICGELFLCNSTSQRMKSNHRFTEQLI